MTRQIIVNFHGLGTPPDRIEAAERPYWSPVAQFEHILNRTSGRTDVDYTFDDGNKTDLEIAAPLLAKHGRTAAFYVLTGRLDDADYLSASDIKTLMALGMRIGLHGRDHIDWRRADDAQWRDETITAREQVAALCGRPVDAVSIPFGAYNRSVMSRLKSAGFNLILTTDEGPCDDRQQVRNRTSIRSDMDHDDIDAILAGRCSPKVALRRALSTFARRHLV